MKETVLLTGATGFLGGYVINELKEQGYKIIAIGRNEERGRELASENVKFICADFTDINDLKNIFKNEKIDYVIHAGALSSAWGKYRDFYDANVKSTVIIGKLAIKYHVKRMVYVSSPSVYSGKEHRFNIKEDEYNPNNTLNYYIMTKLLSERHLHELEKKGLPLIILRPRGLIGPGDPSLMPRLMRANSKIGIPLFHGGRNYVDITCVQNVAYACYLAMVAPEDAVGDTYNITNGEPGEFKKLLKLFCKGAGESPKFLELPFSVVYPIACILEFVYKNFPIPGEPILTRYTVCTLAFSQTLDISKAREKLNYSPKVSLREGIKIYGEWWKENK